MFAVMVGADIPDRFVKHEIAMRGQGNDFTMQAHHIVRLKLLSSFAHGFSVNRDSSLTNQLMNLGTSQVRRMGNIFIQSHKRCSSQAAGTAEHQEKRSRSCRKVWSKGAQICSGCAVTGWGRWISVAASSRRCA